MSLPVMVSGSPGFQFLTPFANPGSGLYQFSPTGGDAGLVRNRTKTRPVKGCSHAALSKVREKQSGRGSAAVDWGMRTRKREKAVHRRYMVRLRGVMESGSPTDCRPSVRAFPDSVKGWAIGR